jgi:glycosyltransferase involved in cell wall biosynthesis
VVLVKDGPLNPELEAVIESFVGRLPLDICALPTNQGLAVALNEGLKLCRHDWVARMDSDDVSLPERFAVQAEFLAKYPDVDVLGACIEERDVNMVRVLALREVPCAHADIKHFARRRSPMSHPVVVFRKTAVIAVGGYPLFQRAQDYALWSLLLVHGYRFANQPECLLWMRTGESLMARRGYQYFLNELRLLRFQREIGLLNGFDYVVNVMARFVLRIVPNRLKQLIYSLAR